VKNVGDIADVDAFQKQDDIIAFADDTAKLEETRNRDEL